MGTEKIKFQFIEASKPTHNSYIERFNRTYRTEVLNAFLFETIQQMWDKTEKFQYKYHNLWLHGSLMDMAPIEFKRIQKIHYSKDYEEGINGKEFKTRVYLI